MINDTNDDINKLFEKLKIITEQSLVGILIIQDGKLKYFNKKVSETSGYSIEEIKGWNPNDFLKIVHPEDQEFVTEQARKRQLADPDVIDEYKYRIVRKNGEIAWIKISTKTINYEGRPAIFAMTYNITEEIRSEQQLRESEEKFSKAFNSNALAMCITTFKESIVVEANKAFLEILGIPEKDIRSKTILELSGWRFDPKDRERIIKCLTDEGIILNTETQFKSSSGEIKYGLSSFVKLELNNKPYVLTIINDITRMKLAEQKLKDSEENFKSIAEQSLMGITVLQDGVFKYFNEKFVEINGYLAEEMKSWAPNEFSKLFHPEDREFVMEQEGKKQAGYPDVLNQYKFRIIRKDGKIRWVEIFSKSINYQGYPADLVTINDISDKINAEKELKGSEEKYQNILENMMEGYLETDLSGKLRYANAEFCKILGFSKEEMIGKNIRLFFDKKSRDILSDISTEVYKTGISRPPTGVVKVSTIKKKLIYFEGILDLLYDSEGSRVGYYAFVRDITQRKIAEQQLKESEEKFRYFADHSLLGITILQDGVFKYFNKKVAETFGTSEEEIKNWGPGDSIKIVYPEDRDIVMREAIKVQSGKFNDVFNYKYRIVKKDGKIGWRETFSKSIIYEGRPAGFGIHIDITEKIEGEQKLKESKEKYLRAYNQAEFYKDLFIHDINNTLQSLYSSTQLIDMDLDEERKNIIIKDLIDVMYRQINRGIKLISNVRKLSQLENHEISLKEVDVFDVLKRSIEFLKNSFQDKKIKIIYDISNEKVSIIGNDLLQDVFENILINSVRHNYNDNVEIVIKSSHRKQDDIYYCKLEFIDNGIGIEDERKKSVLTRADPDSGTTYGMGLGLSLVKKIIDNYGGKIWIEDKVEGEYSKGTKVILLLQKGGS